jgi:hypothetical protein
MSIKYNHNKIRKNHKYNNINIKYTVNWRKTWNKRRDFILLRKNDDTVIHIYNLLKRGQYQYFINILESAKTYLFVIGGKIHNFRSVIVNTQFLESSTFKER